MHNTIITLVNALQSTGVPAWASALGIVNLFGLVFTGLFALGVSLLWVGVALVKKHEAAAFGFFCTALGLLYGTFVFTAFVRYWL